MCVVLKSTPLQNKQQSRGEGRTSGLDSPPSFRGWGFYRAAGTPRQMSVKAQGRRWGGLRTAPLSDNGSPVSQTPVSKPLGYSWRGLTQLEADEWQNTYPQQQNKMYFLCSNVLLTFFILILISRELFWTGIVFTWAKIQEVQKCTVKSRLPPNSSTRRQALGLTFCWGRQDTAQNHGLWSCPDIGSNTNSNQTSCVTLGELRVSSASVTSSIKVFTGASWGLEVLHIKFLTHRLYRSRC